MDFTVPVDRMRRDVNVDAFTARASLIMTNLAASFLYPENPQQRPSALYCFEGVNTTMVKSNTLG